MPRRWAIPFTQLGCVVLLVAFWALFTAGYAWVPVAFYVLGLILGLLLISQFWTLANDIYDARHAKRLFGFIGGGASLGGATGAAITASDGRPRRHRQPAARRRGCAGRLPRARRGDRSHGSRRRASRRSPWKPKAWAAQRRFGSCAIHVTCNSLP